MASAVAACAAIGACGGGENNVDQGNPTSMSSDTLSTPGTQGMDSTARPGGGGMAGESTATGGSTSTGGMADTT